MKETQNNQNNREADQLNLELEKEIENLDRQSGEEFQGYEPKEEKPKKKGKEGKRKGEKDAKADRKEDSDRSCSDHYRAGGSVCRFESSWKKFPFFRECEHEKRG